MNFLVIFFVLIFNSSYADEDFWPEYPVSNENAGYLVSEILSQTNGSIIPKTEDCSISKLTELCSKQKMKSLEKFDSNQKSIIDSIFEKLRSSDELGIIKMGCENIVNNNQPRISKANKWLKNILENKISDEKILKNELNTNFVEEIKTSADHGKFTQKWKDFCKKNLKPQRLSMAEIYFSKMVQNFSYSGVGKTFCEEVGKKDFSWIKDYILQSSSKFLADSIKKVGKNQWFLEDDLRSNISEMSEERAGIKYLNQFYDLKELNEVQNKINGKECERYSQSETIEDQVCECIKRDLEEKIGKIINKDYEKKVNDVQAKLNLIYKKMVNNSFLTESEKKDVLSNHPSPKISMNLFDKALTRASYGNDTYTPPFGLKSIFLQQ